jgi:Fur family ferric uptake transcriptional regulator
MQMSVVQHEPGSDAARLRQRGLRVTGPRLAILSMLERVGGHRSADELVLALRRGGYHHARTTVYNALDDLARAGLVRAAPVDAGALRYESAGEAHHHFVCRECGSIRNVEVRDDMAPHPMPEIEGAELDELDVVYRGRCPSCASGSRAQAQAEGQPASNGSGMSSGMSGPAPQYGRDGGLDGANTMSTGVSGPATGSLLDLRGR